MTKILDQSGDLNGQQTHRLLTLYQVPDFVKTASSNDLYADDLPASCYADPIHRQFPAHTKAATIMSALFLWDNRDNFHLKEAAAIESALYKKAQFFGVSHHFNKIKAEYVKRAGVDPYKDLPDSEFALVLKYADGSVERHYPLRNPMEVKAAAQHLSKFQDVIPMAERQKIAQKILDKASVMGTDLGSAEDYVEKQAGYGVCSAADAADLLMSRASILRAMKKAPEIRVELEKMAKMCINNPAQVRSRDSLVKLARIVDDLDRAAGLVSEYGVKIDRPEDVLFGVSIKTAEQFVSTHCETATGNMYKVADFNKLSLDTVRGVFGDEFADSVSAGGLMVSPEKLAEQLFALPRPDAEIVDRMLAQAGIQPVAVKAANTSSRWRNRDFLRDLADHH